MAKVRCTVVFTFDTGGDTLEQTKEYLEDCPSEALEWMGDDAQFTFEEVVGT